MEQRRNIFDNTRQSLGCWMEEQNEPAYRADQVFGWLYKRRVFSPAEMSTCCKTLTLPFPESLNSEMPRMKQSSTASS
jgi:23S rRNA (adenine2503-C2)-methyltransferase